MVELNIEEDGSRVAFKPFHLFFNSKHDSKMRLNLNKMLYAVAVNDGLR